MRTIAHGWRWYRLPSGQLACWSTLRIVSAASIDLATFLEAWLPRHLGRALARVARGRFSWSSRRPSRSD
jgi:hypothetical protein